MGRINFKKTVPGKMDEIILKVTRALQDAGFGVLTRIDLDAKIREKLGKEISPAVILGACNPQLAYEAYTANPDVASLLPCNTVLREVKPGYVSVEIARPSFMMEMLGDENLIRLAREADQKLNRVLESIARSGEDSVHP